MRHMTSFVLLLLLAALASAEIPQVMSYQGKVTDAGGAPVADGSYTMRFRIYDAVTVGTLLWDSGVQTVAVAGGVFSVLLGESPQPALTLDFSADYWLAVTFAGIDQTPRQRMASVGYAYMASGLVAGTEVSGSVTTGTQAAVKGTNTATTGTTYGGRFEASSTSGRGVYGSATAPTGSAFGVYGTTASTSGAGVYSKATATTGITYGVYGITASTSGRGVLGQATANTGTTYGVQGTTASTSGRGVYGFADATTGITYGVYGSSASTAGYGVYGRASAGSGTTYGVYYSGGLAGTGTKSCVVKTSQGPTLMYCQESPETWFEDFGRGRLVSGLTHVELDPVFLETVTIDDANPMEVFVQLRDECEGVFVKAGTLGFDVRELRAGASSAEFSYRVVAKRKGFETRRLDVCEAARTDSYLYPELKEKEGGEAAAGREGDDE